jgi:hypothetical protein
VGPHAGLSLGDQHKRRILQDGDSGRHAGDPDRSVVSHHQQAPTIKRGLVRRLTRSIDLWWPVNLSTTPQDPAQTAASFPALSSTIAALW